MESKKKILFFMWSFSLGGGAEKILSTIVNNMNLEKYKIDILELTHFDKGFEPVPKSVRVLSNYEKYTQSYWKRSLLWRIRMYFPNFVRNILLKDEYDIEVSFTIMNPPFEFSKRKDVKKIAWIHGSIEDFLEDRSKKESHKKYLANVDSIVSISNKTKKSIEEVYPEYKDKIINIYNGYDFEDIKKKSEENLSEVIFPNSLCSIGRIEKLKGSDKTLEILKNLHDKGIKYHLYYIGSGELEDELKDKSIEYGLRDYVHFLGYQKNPYKYLKKMKLLLSMSLQEGFPGVFVEALSLGVPFVSTDVGGAEELSQNGKFGKIIYNENEAMEEIVDLMENSKTNKKEMKEFVSQFTIRKQIENIEKLIES